MRNYAKRRPPNTYQLDTTLKEIYPDAVELIPPGAPAALGEE